MRTSLVVRAGAAALGVLAIAGCALTPVNVAEPGHGMIGVGVTNPPEISDDGRVVVFQSSDFLTAEDHEGTWDIYGRDIRAGRTELLSISPGGVQDPCGSNNPAMSGDGRYVSWAACSSFGDVPPPAGTIGTDLYVADRRSGALEHIGVPEELDLPAGGFGFLDGDGSHIVFWCFPQPRAEVHASACVQDRRTLQTTVIARRDDGELVRGFVVPTSISDDGNLVTFVAPVADVIVGSTDVRQQLFVRDVAAGVTDAVAVDPAVLPGDVSGVISGDGTAAVLWQVAPPYHIVHVDLPTGAVHRVDQARCAEVAPSPTYALASISDDGDVVAFQSSSSELVTHDTNDVEDAFVWRAEHPCAVQRVSVDLFGAEGDRASYWPAVSGDGSSVAFISEATTFRHDETPDAPDAFVARIGPRAH